MNSVYVWSVIRTDVYRLRWLAVWSYIGTLWLSVSRAMSRTSHCGRLVVSVAWLEVRL
jgi:hypothetical protein